MEIHELSHYTLLYDSSLNTEAPEWSIIILFNYTCHVINLTAVLKRAEVQQNNYNVAISNNKLAHMAKAVNWNTAQ